MRRRSKQHRDALGVAGLTAGEAKRQLIQEMESQARLEASEPGRNGCRKAKNAEREARGDHRVLDPAGDA